MNMLEAFKTWGGPKDAFEVIQVRDQGADMWTAELRATATPSFSVTVQKPRDEPRVLVVHRMEIPADVIRVVTGNQEMAGDLRAIVSAVEELRAATVRCALLGNGVGKAVEIQVVIYQDGFSRHTLNVATLEVGRARRMLATRFESLVGTAHALVQLQQQLAEEQKRHDQLMSQAKSKLPPAAQAERRCPKCGRPVPAGKKFCTYDGTPVP